MPFTTLDNRNIVNVLTDSGVYQFGEGYERTILVNKWHPESDRLMAKVDIRIDRLPSESRAMGLVWISASQTWMPLIKFSPQDFWPVMPGYLRWANDTSDDKTWTLAGQIMDELIDLAEQTDLLG